MFYNIEMRNWITLGACGFVFLNFMTAAETRWIRIASSNFDMYTTAGERSARATLQYFEQVRSFFAKRCHTPLRNRFGYGL